MNGITRHSTAPKLKYGLGATLMALTMVVGMTPTSVAAAAPEASAHALFDKTPKTDWAALKRAAEQDGSVAVIVQLPVDAKRADALSTTDRRQQRSKIKSTRDALLTTDFHKAKLRGLKVSDDLPLVAFDATLEDLVRLQNSHNKVAVTIDHEIKAELGTDSGRHRPIGASPRDVKEQATGNGTASTSTNGTGNVQLTNWWDWYRIGVDVSSAAGWTGAGQTIAMLDTGVDRTHPWLQGKVVAEACFSMRNAVGTAGAGGCPNGQNVQYGTGAAAPCTYNAICAHGTHTAQTAAGRWGVAPGANIIAVQIFHDKRDSAHSATYFESDLVWALSYVYNLRTSYKIAAINMSIGAHVIYPLGSSCDAAAGDGTTDVTYLAGWINALKAVGIASVISSGNDDDSLRVGRPACIQNAVTVGNTTYDASGYDAVYGRVAGGSNSSSLVDLLAPGTDICSAVPNNGVDCGWIGTSMAAPHAAGAFAILRQKRPAASVDTIVSVLRTTGVGVYDDRNGLIRSRINLVGALNGI